MNRPRQPAAPTGNVQPIYVGSHEAEALFGVKAFTLRLWARQGRIPAKRAGRLVLFNVQAVAAAIANFPDARMGA